jgi:hypothetical protein
MSVINKDENICVSADPNDVSVCGQKPSRCSNSEQHMAEGETEDLVHGGDLQLLSLLLLVLHTFL